MSKKSVAVSKQKAKGSRKLKKFKISPMIIIIAILELVILIGAVSYAWYALSAVDQINGEITVSPDSGLRIDFAQQSQDFVDIWRYLTEDFEFEPATSVDGRNIFFPTTGTFNETSTNEIKFREGTVNDVNSKYISIDFTLTNERDPARNDPNDDGSVKVYLNNKSYFRVDDGTATGRAMRIAFYQNDNKSGKVNSALMERVNASDKTIIYFNDNLGWATSGRVPYVYLWDDNTTGKHLKNWPGSPMTKASGDQYYFLFNNTAGYNKVIFSDGVSAQGESSTKQTINLDLVNNQVYTPTSQASGGNYQCSFSDYNQLVSNTGYAVIAPGISTGFQRPYAPVSDMYPESGQPKTIIPAFAYSIDDYFQPDTNVLFTLGPHETQSLSMIMWLEGTDAACVDTSYAAKHISLYLEFSTSVDDGQNKDTYVLHDCTKERWLPDTQTINEVDFEPVMQLYDKTLKRGYLMTPVPENKDNYKNASTADPQWTVSIPSSLSGDEFEFRRVNPNDEEEVWNYWDAGVNHSQKSGNAYHFSIFADGSPTKYYQNGSLVESDQRSCGGLWGDYSQSHLKKLTVYDASEKRTLSTNKGVLTIAYTAVTGTYTLGGTTYNYEQTIEYKASTVGNAYVFMVPDLLLNYTDASRASVTFKRYYNFNDKYAINAHEEGRNDTITYDKSWSVGQAKGAYYNINDANNNNYWGSDFLIVQVESGAGDYNSTSKWIQVKYFDKSDEGTTHSYSYCYNDGTFKDSANNSFASVVPCDRAYTAYRVQQCTKNNHSKVEHQTAPVSAGMNDNNGGWYNTDSSFGNGHFEYADAINYIARIKSTSVAEGIYNNILKGGNLISLREYYVYAFLQCHYNDAPMNKDPYIHIWDGGTDATLPMKYIRESGGYKYFHRAIPLKYKKFQFKRQTDNKYWPSDHGSVSDLSGNVFKTNTSFTDKEDKWAYANDASSGGWDAAENTAYAIYNKTSWDYSGVGSNRS